MTRPAALRLGVPARGMLAHRTLPQLLAPNRLVPGRRRNVDVLLAWGRRPSALWVERLARKWDLPVWHLEDGLLRSVAKGKAHPPLGLMVDELGVHFDATAPSQMEQLIAGSITSAEADRARALQSLWREQRLSKVNPPVEAEAPQEPYVLVVDQSAGDRSIALGLADASCFQRMLQAALEEYPDCTVVLKVHPDVISGRAQGHFSAKDLAEPRVLLSADGGHPARLLERARAVYVVTSQMGFEALLWGRPVHCFGMPFYAGWGLTHDRCEAPIRRRQGASLEALVHAALVAGCRCIDPHRHQHCRIETLMAAIGLQRRLQAQQPRRCVAFGFTPWKQRNLRRFLGGSQLRFRAPWRRIPQGVDAVVIWGQRARPRLLEAAARRQLPVLHVEDGFLRSVGLGADLVDPVSWVVDHQGVYYDATRPSDLETRLATGQWTSVQCQRAAALRQRLVKEAITKYNLQAEAWRRPPGNRRVVLVIGQVESDASIQYGAPGIRSNRALLAAVREAEPEAYLVYKPHPDVVAGLCRAGVGEDDAFELCDQVLPQGSIQQLFTQIDALHVLTSLAGFEALLRGVEVHCWGMPFYAGWGLTHDRECCSRRQRKLSLDELVHAALIDYPRYVSRDSGWFITPEQAIDDLVAWRASPPQRRTLVQALFRHWGRLRRR